MNRQEIFDTVVTNLLKQGKRSFGPYKPNAYRYAECNLISVCLYRSPDGSKCAVGWLIPDELYVPQLENMMVPTNGEENDVSHVLTKAGISKDDFYFLYRLQRVHDSCDVENWDVGFSKIAQEYGLAMPSSNEESIERL